MVRLILYGAPGTDLSPLRKTPLRQILFSARHIPPGVDILRTMTTLESINRKSPDEFWKEYDHR